MITRIEAIGYRCLRDVQQTLTPFQVLVGPNASGKTTFLDVVTLLAGVVSEGLEETVLKRTNNPQDLTWARSGEEFQLAVEARLPPEVVQALGDQPWTTIRYEVGIRVTPELEFSRERITVLAHSLAQDAPPPESFPRPSHLPRSAIGPTRWPPHIARTVVNKVSGGKENYYSETSQRPGKGWGYPYKLGRRRSVLRSLPDDESQFPATIWLKALLESGVQAVVLDGTTLRKSSPPNLGRTFRPDGANLPWLVHHHLEQSPERLADWVAHLRTALPELRSVRTVEEADNRHRYLMLGDENGIEVPSWLASDGTLRLMALTLPAYLPDFQGIYLIEEPENGIHPRAVETLYQSLSSTYGAQILMATHSPVVLNLARPDAVLCFAKSAGQTDIVTGDRHPMLSAWRGETTLGDLLAAGVLG